MMKNDIIAVLLLLLCLEIASAAYTPFLGCDEDFAYGIPVGDECYAVDSSLCKFKYPTGCEQVTSSVMYYNGGERADKSFTYEADIYQSLDISATNGRCGSSATTVAATAAPTCSVTINGQTCQSCVGSSSTNFKQITVNCDNVQPAVIQTGNHDITLVRGGGYLPLVADAKKCEHPAIANRISMSIEGEFAYTFGSPVTSGTITESTTQDLVDSTQQYYQDLLTREFSLFQTIEINDWNTRFVGTGTGGTLTLTINRATLMWDPTATTMTVEDIAPVMTQASLLNGAYLAQHVRTSNPAFRGVTSVVGSIEELAS